MEDLKPVKNKIVNILGNLIHADFIGAIMLPDSFMTPDKRMGYLFNICLKNGANLTYTDPDPHALVTKYINYVEDWTGRTPASMGIDPYSKLGVDSNPGC